MMFYQIPFNSAKNLLKNITHFLNKNNCICIFNQYRKITNYAKNIIFKTAISKNLLDKLNVHTTKFKTCDFSNFN